MEKGPLKLRYRTNLNTMDSSAVAIPGTGEGCLLTEKDHVGVFHPVQPPFHFSPCSEEAPSLWLRGC
jgi:hypothetical protein